jgi:membrane protease YdiL (CAAX protease family)
MRGRAAIELAVLAVLSALYLGLFPERPLPVDAGMALLGGVLVAVGARQTRAWDAPAMPGRVRFRRSAASMAGFTLPALGLLAAASAWSPAAGGWSWPETGRALVSPRLAVTLAVFVPWALLQQALLQLYLLGRLRALWPSASPAVTSALAGALFGAVHLPDAQLALLTAVAGAVWTHAYQRDRQLLPVALSHAVLGTAYVAWVRRVDPFAALGWHP